MANLSLTLSVTRPQSRTTQKR